MCAQDFEELLTFLKVEPVQWAPQRLRRVLNAAIASPLTAQDLADADAAVQQGFTGSLSRAPTFSAEAEAAVPAESEEEAEAGGGMGPGVAGVAPPEAAAVAAAAAAQRAQKRGRHSRGPSGASQQAGCMAMEPAAADASGGGGDDVVADELAAAQQQIDDEVRWQGMITLCTNLRCADTPVVLGVFSGWCTGGWLQQFCTAIVA